MTKTRNLIRAYLRLNRFKLADILVLMIYSLLFSIASWAVQYMDNLMLAYSTMIVLVGFAMSFTGLSVRKLGSVVLFTLVASLLTMNTSTIGIFGGKKVLVFVITGIIFELSFLLLRLNGMTLDMIISTSVSCALMPLLLGVIVSLSFFKEHLINMMNLSLISLISGIAGSLIAVVIWDRIRNLKFFVELRYAP